jgi:DNA-binding CsgD family transcriptional regulator
MTPLVGRSSETHAVEAVLDSVAVESTALIIEGDPGIGKTTLWRDALARARERGMRVLAARASAAESVLAYTTLADLLTDIDHAMWADLPTPQRCALAAALLEDSDGTGSANDPRAVGAAFLTVLTRLAAGAPVLLGIDDLQWLDASSAAAIGFATRRLSDQLIIVATVRTDAAATATGWVQSALPDTVRRIRLPPLPIGELHDVLSAQLGHPVGRPRLVRIHEMSGGNPFYAVELAHEFDRHPSDAQLALPESLAGLMRARIGRVHGDAADALLAIASLGDPTVHMVAAALERTPPELIDLLGDAEEQGVLAIAGQRLRFTHPLLAHAVHTGATPARRRSTHRRLAEVVAEPELRARHLALADPAGEPETLDALDVAAGIARSRGAPAAAAELLDLAISRGGATPQRRIQLAQCLFDSGDPRRARDALEAAIIESPPGPHRAQARQRLAMVRLLDDSFPEATGLLEQALADCGEDSKLQITALTMLAFTQLNSGHPDTALVTAEQAFAAAQRLGHDEALGRALSMRAIMRFFNGDGAEPAELQHAAALESADERVPVALRPSVQTILLRGWTGDYAVAREQLSRIAADCAALGEEGELMFLAYQITLFDIWRGELGRATDTANDALRRAHQLGGEAASFVASSLQAAVAAYQGRVQDARRHIDVALVAGAGSGYVLMMGYVVSLQGFVELSLGNHEQALAFLEPLLPMVQLAPRNTEILIAGFLPDAVEALINRGRVDEAEPLVAALEDNGARLTRPWMLAAGARCRAMLTAARGDLDMAAAQTRQALRHHDRLDMPFERARTLLLLGRLERRLRRWRPAAATLSEAEQLFDRVGTPLWTAQVRTELQRGSPGRARTSGLTPSERRVAELAADGMSTKGIAAALFVAPKTVDTNLSRVYSKLGIHSRIELIHALKKGNTDAPADGRPPAPDG